MRAGAALRAGISGNEDFPWVSGNPVVDAKTKLSDGGLGETALPLVVPKSGGCAFCSVN